MTRSEPPGECGLVQLPTPMSELNRFEEDPLPATLGLAMLLRPGEAESGSAGVQPDKEYPGRRCADGAAGLLG
jgi:hypothetical protein